MNGTRQKRTILTRAIHFCSQILFLKHFYKLPDEELTSKLVTILKDVAFIWYKSIIDNQRNKSWNGWKSLIENKFGEAMWKQRQLRQLAELSWSHNTNPLKFLMKVYKKLKALYPHSSFVSALVLCEKCTKDRKISLISQ